MASFTCDAMEFWASQNDLFRIDLVPLGSSQAGATPVGNAQYVRSNLTAASTGFILPSVGNLDASGVIFIANEGANTVAIYPAAGEVINALSANASINCAANALAVCIRIPKHLGTVHGRTTPATAGWSVGTCPSVT